MYLRGSVSPVKLEKLQAKLKATKTTLESADQAQIASLTRDDILGDMFYASIVLKMTEFALRCPGEAGVVFGIIFGVLTVATMFLTGLKAINSILGWIISKVVGYALEKVADRAFSTRLCRG